MAVNNTVTRFQGTKSIPATANLSLAPNSARTSKVDNIAGGRQRSLMSVGDSIQTFVEIFDKDGVSLGIQDFTTTVSIDDAGYDEVADGIDIYAVMRNHCKSIRELFDPFVSCWASRSGYDRVEFNIAPKGSDGIPFPARVSYESCNINSWIVTIA